MNYPKTSVGLPLVDYYTANAWVYWVFRCTLAVLLRGFPQVAPPGRENFPLQPPPIFYMPLDLLIVAVTRRSNGRTFIGWGEGRPGRLGFVRLVAPVPSGVLYPENYLLSLASEPRPLDLVRIEAPWADSRPGQPENRIVDDTPWQLLERPVRRGPLLEGLERLVPHPGPLFGGPGRMVRPGPAAFEESLQWVAPQYPRAVCHWDPGREQYRARFRFVAAGIEYDLPLTDLHFAQRVLSRGEGVYTLESIGCRSPHGLRLLASLGEPFHGWCYKMVAALYPLRTVTLWRDDCSPRFPFPNGFPADVPLGPPRAFARGA